MRQLCSKTWGAAVLALCLILTSGCGLMSASPVSTAPAEPVEGQTTAGPVSMDPIGRYYDFDDIQVPNGLNLNPDASMVFWAGGVKAGLLVFDGNLELQSLINYFIDGMAKDNWALKSSYKYPQSALFFAKQGKTCVIHIVDTNFSTRVNIWVAPTLDNGSVLK